MNRDLAHLRSQDVPDAAISAHGDTGHAEREVMAS